MELEEINDHRRWLSSLSASIDAESSAENLVMCDHSTP